MRSSIKDVGPGLKPESERRCEKGLVYCRLIPKPWLRVWNHVDKRYERGTIRRRAGCFCHKRVSATNNREDVQVHDIDASHIHITMFGCCVAGRLLQTNLQQIDETKAAFELPAAETINHVCVFLLGSGEQPSFLCIVHQYQPWVLVPFPDGYGATVHFFWPGKGFRLLGMSVFTTQFFIILWLFTLHPVNLQVVERKALGHPSFAWEFRVANHFLTSGIFQPGATYN